MPFMQWEKNFELGIKEFDDHHLYLVGLLNSIYDCFTQGVDHAYYAKIIDEMIDYATYHFSSEEQWMKGINYPPLAEHKREHEHFCQRVNEFQRDFYDGRSKLTLEMLEFLNTWLKDHILKSDAEYGAFARKLKSSLVQVDISI